MYRFSFEAKSEPNLSLVFYIGKASSPFNSYSGFQTTRLTDEYLEYSTVFKMSDPSDPNARIVFDMGLELGNTYFRKIKVQELDLVILSVREENPVKPKIYPNPVKNLLTIDLLNPGAQIELYNTIGQKVNSFLVNGKQQKVDMGQLPPGIYVLRLKRNNNIWEHFRVIKE
jgi:hypothetical protein